MIINMIKKLWSKEQISLNHKNPELFVKSSWCHRVTLSFVLYRVLYASALLITLIWSMMNGWNGGKWFIYLTDWAYLNLVLQACLIAVLVFKFYMEENKNILPRVSEQISSNSMPVICKIYWFMYNCAITGAILITIVYWTVINKSLPSKNHPFSVSSTYILHIGNSIAVSIDFLIGGPPVRFLHVLFPIIFGTTYGVFTYIYYLLGGTDPMKNTAIYTYLNWEENYILAIGLVIGCNLLMVFIQFAITCAAHLRDNLIERFKESN